MDNYIIFVIVAVIAAIVEIARRYFVVYRYCEEQFRTVHFIPAVLLVFSMALPFISRDFWALNVVASIIAIVVDFFVVGLSSSQETVNNTKAKKEDLTKEDKKILTVFFSSYAIPMIFCLFCCVWVSCVDTKAFETQWQQTEVMTLVEEPTVAIIKGDTKCSLETETEEFVFYIDEDNFDALKLKKGDKFRYLEQGERKRFEVITLRGEAYSE